MTVRSPFRFPPAFVVQVAYENGDVDTVGVFKSLRPGETVTIDYPPPPFCGAGGTITIDPANQVRELNERNNTFTFSSFIC